MRWLVIGDFDHDIYERSIIRALQAVGVDAHGIAYSSAKSPSASQRLSRKYPNPVFSTYVERRVARALAERQPTHVLVWRGEPIGPRQLARLRYHAPGAHWVYYSNDFLFSREDSRRWRYVRGALSLYDTVLAYREADKDLLERTMGLEANIWLPGYDPDILGPEQPAPLATRLYDLAFVGHHAPDGREELIREIARQGFTVKVWGPRWPSIPNVDSGPPVYGLRYAAALRSARLALVLYSLRNHDTVTRRCFELPYVGTPMLARRSPTMLDLFREGREALYFDSSGDAVTIIERALQDPVGLERLQATARTRVDEVHGSTAARARELISYVSERQS